ncbi:MAG: hypothetical protein ACPG32_08900 [Akkermansiaceae bacterium]
MSTKFEDLMRPGFSQSLLSPVSDPPDAVRWVNLLTALTLTFFCVAMSRPESWGDGFLFIMFYGMILGPVIFMLGHGFTTMCGGTSSWWVSIALLVVTSLVCGYFLLSSFGLLWF